MAGRRIRHWISTSLESPFSSSGLGMVWMPNPRWRREAVIVWIALAAGLRTADAAPTQNAHAHVVNDTRVNLHLANRCDEDLLVYWYNPLDKMLKLHYNALAGLRSPGSSEITFLTYAGHTFLISSVALDTERPVEPAREGEGPDGLSSFHSVNTTQVIMGMPLHPGSEPPEVHTLVMTRGEPAVPGGVGQLMFAMDTSDRAATTGPSAHERAIFRKVRMRARACACVSVPV